MKKILFACFFASIVLTSCDKKSTTNKNYSLISGKVSNSIVPKLILITENNQTNIPISQDGTFSDTLRVKKGFYKLVSGRDYIPFYTDGSSDLHIEFDGKNIDETVKFSGPLTSINTYVFEKETLIRKFLPSPREVFSKTEDSFVKVISELNQKSHELLSSHNLDKEFANFESRNIDYLKDLNLLYYEQYFQYVTGNKEFKISENFPLPKLTLKSFNDINDYNFSQSYKQLILFLINQDAKKIIKLDPLVKQEFALLKASKKIENEKIRNDYLSLLAASTLSYTSDLEGFYSKFNELCTDEFIKEKIANIYSELRKLSKGSPSPEFSNYENHSGGTVSLKDFRGKYVYIDVWATWCKPCLNEIPSLTALEEDYENNENIEFISLSVDDKKDYDKWQKMVADENLKGIQLFSDDGFNSEFIKSYKIDAIPRFILIDPKGNIVDSNAPRPSDSRIRSLFNEFGI